MADVTRGLELAAFTPADARALFAVRNDASVRAYMADPSPLEWEAHFAWTRANLGEGSDTRLFMIRVRGTVRGFSVLKRVAPGVAEIGVMVREPGSHPAVAALATAATLEVAFERMACDALVSWVVPGHERALAINVAFGAHEVASTKPGMLEFRLTRGECLGNAQYRRLAARLAARRGRAED